MAAAGARPARVVAAGGGTQSDLWLQIVSLQKYLIDPEGKTDYVVVNVLVKGGELDIVTKDEIESARADLVVDAGNGVLFGQLELGEPPSCPRAEDPCGWQPSTTRTR